MSLTRDMMSRQDLLVALDEMEKLYAAGCAAWNPVYKEVLNDRDRLTARVEELEGTLRQIAGIDPWVGEDEGYVDKARAALTQPTQETHDDKA